MRALLVEDDDLGGRFAMGVLKRMGVEADWVKDGRSALDAAATREHEVIFLDLGLPELPGFAVAKAIRAREAACGAPRVRIIALTASDPSREELASFGIDEFVTKPLSQKKAQELLSGSGSAPG